MWEFHSVQLFQMGWIDLENFNYGGVSWLAGEILCRGVAFLGVFGLYVSGFLIACITVDRLLAVRRPVPGPKAVKRARIMARIAGITSLFCSVVEVRPNLAGPWPQF